MSILNIFALHFQQILNHRLRSLVWLLIPLANNLTLILFWTGAMKNSSFAANWTITAATTYYFLLTIAGAMLNSHIEEDVAVLDIQQGDLTRYLIRPFPYYWIKFIEEIPYRILQGTYGILIMIFFTVFFGKFISLTRDPIAILATILMAVMAFFIMFTMKMNLGLSAFWFKDSRGAFELVYIMIIVLSGGVIPLFLFPKILQTIAYLLPFAYTAFFPILALQGQLTYLQLLQAIGMQTIWLGFFIVLNRIMWSRGIKEFTSHGQ